MSQRRLPSLQLSKQTHTRLSLWRCLLTQPPSYEFLTPALNVFAPERESKRNKYARGISSVIKLSSSHLTDRQTYFAGLSSSFLSLRVSFMCKFLVRGERRWRPLCCTFARRLILSLTRFICSRWNPPGDDSTVLLRSFSVVCSRASSSAAVHRP